MHLLGFIQAVAATHLVKSKRGNWLLAGGKVEKVKGRKQWKASFDR
jgi:hypothetical protein